MLETNIYGSIRVEVCIFVFVFVLIFIIFGD